MLLDVARTAVEDPHQSFFVKAVDLVLQRLHVRHAVTIGESEFWHCWPWWQVAEQGVDLRGDHPI